MEGYTDGDYKVVTQMVPTVRYTSVKTAIQAADTCNPDFILCVGQAGGRPDITIERVAIKLRLISAFQTMVATNLRMNLL